MSVIGEGSEAPAFSMTNQDGNPVALGDFAGKYVLSGGIPKPIPPDERLKAKGSVIESKNSATTMR